MTTEERDKRSEAIVKYLGYKYVYYSNEDLSDIGGLETKCKIYSKIPLEIDYSLASKHWVDDRDKFIFTTQSGYDVDFNNNELKYYSSWDWLMPVCKKILKEIGNQYTPALGNITNVLKEVDIEKLFIELSDYCLNYKS